MAIKGKYIAAWQHDYDGNELKNPSWYGPFDTEDEARKSLQNASRSPNPVPVRVALFFPPPNISGAVR
jgi:hypothetical protein